MNSKLIEEIFLKVEPVLIEKNELELEKFLRGSSPYDFWQILQEIIDDKNLDSYVIENGQAVVTSTYYGNMFTRFLNKKVGSRKRSGTWDYKLISLFYSKTK